MSRVYFKLFFVFCFFVLVQVFALEISPNLVYQIETSKNIFTYSFFVKNDIPGESLINIEIIDFITDGKNYVFDDPSYKYSLRKYVSLREYNFTLKPQEQKEVSLNFDVPADFPGASGIFALKISQESVSGGKVQLRLNYIVPFFVRFNYIPVFQSIKIANMSVRNLLQEPDEKYGNFGSLVTIELENNGNLAFIPKGSIQITSRELRTTITEIPVDSFDLVIFPEKKTYYTFYTPYILPSGTLDIFITGKSYGMDFQFSGSVKNNNEVKDSLYYFDRDVLLFSDKTKTTIQSFNIMNLSPLKESVNVLVDNQKVSILPKKVIIYPYKSTSFSVRISEKDFNFSGDRIYAVNISDVEGNQRSAVNNLLIVFRGNTVRPNIEAQLKNDKNQSILVVRNSGDCILEFNVIYQGNTVNDSPLRIFPGQTINLELGRIVQSSNLAIEYNVYGEREKFKLENVHQ
ncbi:MAG: hypothetical protein ACP5PP_06130 [Fervidobacterium sp.]